MGLREELWSWARQPAGPVGVRDEYADGLLLLTHSGIENIDIANLPLRNLAPNGGAYIFDSFSTTTRDFRASSRVGPVRGAGVAALTVGYRLDATLVNAALSATGEATVLAIHRSNAQDSGGNKGPMCLRASGDDEHYPYTDGFVYLGPFAGGRWVSGVTSPVSVSEPHAVAASHKSGAQEFWIAGQRLATGSRVETPAISTLGTQSFGGNGTSYLFVLWNRVLPLSALQELTANPWQLFAPRRIWIPTAAAGGGASTADVAVTGESGVFSGTAQSVSSVALATTGNAGAFAGTAQTNATATLAVTGDSGTFAGTASTGASAVLAVTGDSGTFAGTATTPASVSLAVTGDAGTFAGSAFSSATATLSVTGDAGTFSGLASTVGTADVAVTGDSGTFDGTAFSVTTSWLASLGDSGVFSGSASVAAPATVGRPASDTSNSGWAASTGSDLYAMLDEVTPDPVDYIVATSVGAVCELALNATSYPGTASQTLKFRASSSTGNSVIVRLRNTGGATVRTVTQALTASDTEYSVTLSAGEIAAITSGALSVQLESA